MPQLDLIDHLCRKKIVVSITIPEIIGPKVGIDFQQNLQKLPCD